MSQKAIFAPAPLMGCVRRKTDVRHYSKMFWYITKDLPYCMEYFKFLDVVFRRQPYPTDD